MKIYIHRVNNFLHPEELNLDGFLCIRFESEDGTHLDIDASEYTKNGISIIGNSGFVVHPRAANHVWIEVE